MNKLDFLIRLQNLLHSIPEADQLRSIDYYREIIEDRMEEGLSEEEAVAAVGDPQTVAASILAETPVIPPTPVKKRRLTWWEILLLVLGSPVWVPLLGAAVIVLFSVWIILWSVVISLYATAVALGASAIGCIFGSILMIDTGSVSFLTAWGGALICAGVCILLWLLSNLAAKGMVWLTKWLLRTAKTCFTRKEMAA